MKPADHILPVFALEASATWGDLMNEAEAVVNYEATVLGKPLPLILFSPMTKPANPDCMEPMETPPENLLIISVERPMDALVLKALEQARPVLGEAVPAPEDTGIDINYDLPLADVFEQMRKAGVQTDWMADNEHDDASFFFLRGSAAVEAFGEGLWDAACLRY
ncbi:MAG: hypothetical protein HZC54_20770 [Verrucomicrobia bacterium]|nr:hypothetical protein [Verrucomicrobiota bacterium]